MERLEKERSELKKRRKRGEIKKRKGGGGGMYTYIDRILAVVSGFDPISAGEECDKGMEELIDDPQIIPQIILFLDLKNNFS